MSEKNLKKRLELQQKIISRQSEQIDDLKNQIEELKSTIEEKDKLIKSVEPLRNELTDIFNEVKHKKDQYGKLVQELRDMKKIMNQEVYKGKWWLIRLLIK